MSGRDKVFQLLDYWNRGEDLEAFVKHNLPHIPEHRVAEYVEDWRKLKKTTEA